MTVSGTATAPSFFDSVSVCATVYAKVLGGPHFKLAVNQGEPQVVLLETAEDITTALLVGDLENLVIRIRKDGKK